MTDPKNISVLDLCVRVAVERHGLIKGGRVAGRVAAFVQEWAWYQRDTGHDPGTVLEYSRWAHVSERTAFRRLSDFRVLFPEWETPAPLARYVPVKAARSSSSSSPVAAA